ncbi:MAG: MBL fold metallo-hydrolase [Candidatus Glassbacteria bacterium]|nr:MBL fold metallo-hydrolase [Candidatus Glassbacteria bacterium]
MKTTAVILAAACLMLSTAAGAKDTYQTDFIATSDGALMVSFIGHGTLMFVYDGKVIHVDPCGREADYARMPAADLVLITHEHGDHLDPEALGLIAKENTVILLNANSFDKINQGTVMRNGEARTELGLAIEAVPAYNIVHKRDSGEPFHPRGNGNGYVITFGDKRVYVAGDTENIPEMQDLQEIDIAFLPVNLPYTMTPEMAAEASRVFRPKVLYPYHYGSTEIQRLVDLLEGEGDIEVRIREMQ